jgi:endonuclease G, mitochondrial
MDLLERAARLQKMLAQISPDSRIESIPMPSGQPTAGGLESMDGAARDRTAIETGLDKLAGGRHDEINKDEMFGLEAIVMRENRPVVFVRNGTYDDLGNPWTDLNKPEVKTRLNALLPLVGRVEVPRSPILPYAGTGFVVGKGLIATNRHVAQIFALGLGRTIRYQPGDAAIDFKKEGNTPEDDRSAYLTVVGVEMIHPYWDMALLRVDNLQTNSMLRLSTKSPADLMRNKVVAVGYPARDERNDLALQDKVFEGKYFVKRLQPGVIRDRALIRSFENLVNSITHDASTLGGNSGSAIIDIDSGEVVALHFAGEYLKANYAVPMYELARDDRVSRLLNFDGTLIPTRDFDAAWRSTEGSERIVPPSRQPEPTRVARLQSSPSAATVADHDGRATWTIPLRVSVAIGHPIEHALHGPIQGGEEEAVVVDQNYSDRPGYDPHFLEDIAVLLPALGETMKADTAHVRPDAVRRGDAFELTYYHYSVYMNKRRRTAWFSAANVDGDLRPNIGKRAGDRWYIDPRILKSEQLGQEAFEHGIDRGHLTRREDTAWGENVDTATRANNDTFHFTNCSLQASPFNRGKDRWQGLEQFLLEQHAKKNKRRMIVITGPLFAQNDPVYKNDQMTYSVRCPLQFWKVCVLIREDGTPAATGFVLGQEDIRDLPGFEEAFDVAATQIKIADLETRTGLNFGEVKLFDHFAQSGTPGTLELPAREGRSLLARVIRGGRDIVI